jgi:hypothetical protein
MCGPVSLELDLSGYATIIFFILAADADAWVRHYFYWNETCFPKILEPRKQDLKIIKYEQFIFGHLLFK